MQVEVEVKDDDALEEEEEGEKVEEGEKGWVE